MRLNQHRLVFTPAVFTSKLDFYSVFFFKVGCREVAIFSRYLAQQTTKTPAAKAFKGCREIDLEGEKNSE